MQISYITSLELWVFDFAQHEGKGMGEHLSDAGGRQSAQRKKPRAARRHSTCHRRKERGRTQREREGPDPERERGREGREEAACWTEEKEQTVFTEEGCSYL